MPASNAPSEFGGRAMRNGVQPSPHVPTVNERLMLLYTTGDESGLSDRDNGEVFSGLLPEEKQRTIRQAEGVLDKGQEWEALLILAEPEIAELAPET